MGNPKMTLGGAPNVDPATVADRNAEISRGLLADWQTAPDRFVAYYSFPAEHLSLFGKARPWRARFAPVLHTYVNQAKPGDPPHDHAATVQLWTGEIIGRITGARVYAHNFGSRMVSLRVVGSNGARYYGRASWDWGNVIRLRKVRG